MANKVHFLGEDNKGPRGGVLYVFHCPGCEYSHPFEICCSHGGWTWNGSLDKPTFSPSLLVGADVPEARCHSFVRDGMIEFLSDCHHSLAGKTVELPDWDSLA